MIARIIRWLDRRTLREQRDYAGAQFALALAYGDLRRADRLRIIMDRLERQMEERA